MFLEGFKTISIYRQWGIFCLKSNTIVPGYITQHLYGLVHEVCTRWSALNPQETCTLVTAGNESAFVLPHWSVCTDNLAAAKIK